MALVQEYLPVFDTCITRYINALASVKNKKDIIYIQTLLSSYLCFHIGCVFCYFPGCGYAVDASNIKTLKHHCSGKHGPVPSNFYSIKNIILGDYVFLKSLFILKKLERNRIKKCSKSI